MAKTRLLLGQIGFGLMHLLLSLCQFTAQCAVAVGNGHDAGLTFKISERIFSLIEAGSNLVGLLGNEIECTGGAMDFKVFVKVPRNQFA